MTEEDDLLHAVFAAALQVRQRIIQSSCYSGALRDVFLTLSAFEETPLRNARGALRLFAPASRPLIGGLPLRFSSDVPKGIMRIEFPKCAPPRPRGIPEFVSYGSTPSARP